MPTILPALLTDAAAMHAVQQRAFEEEGRRCGTREIPPLQETTEGIARHIQDHLALVAREDGRIVGCVRGLLRDGVCTVRGLVVEPACHGRGLGSALIRALEAAMQGVQRIELSTNSAMPGNVPFYLRHGYEVVEYTTPLPGITLAQMRKLLPVGVPAPPMPESTDPDLGFTHRQRKNGDLEVLHHGRVASTLRGRAALELADELSQCTEAEAQQLMARVTGNYKRGNEKQASFHPRNRR